MTVSSLLVMVPTRDRRENCERLLKSFEEMTDSAELVFITDGDDGSYEGMDWGVSTHAVLDPRESTAGKVNRMADVCAADYDALMFIGDDNVFVTPHWDTVLMGALADMGGSGMVYPDDRRRNDIPETIVISSDVVMALGHFMDPRFNHFYVDNVWAELGKRTGLLRFVPEVVVDHLHYSIRPEVAHDKTYSDAEMMWGESDRAAFGHWRANFMLPQVSRLRRDFNPDVKWLLGKV